jgi:hypothetical protein
MIFGDDRLNLELFVDFGHIVAPLLKRLIKERNENELNNDYKGIPARTRYLFKDGSFKVIDAYIYDFDPNSQRFLI